MLADGRLLFDGAPGGAVAPRRRAATSSSALVAFLAERERGCGGRGMRSLLRKDLLILRRSRLLLALLVLYPIAIALLIGFAISRSPAKPRVAIVDETPPGETVQVGSQRVERQRVREPALQPGRPGARVLTRRRRPNRSNPARSSRPS